PLVITGLHHTTLAIDSQLIADFGSTNLWPMICLSNIAQGAAVLAVVIAHRGNKKEEQISVPSVISAWLGVTEPAIFGINLKYVYPFVAAMIGSGIAGMFITIMKVRANAIGVGGLPGILAIKNSLGAGKGTGAQGYLIFLIAMAIAIVVPIVLTLFFRKAGIFNKLDRVEQTIPVGLDEVDETPKATEAKVVAAGTKTDVKAPFTGQLLPLAEAKDPVFAQGTMGQGVVIDPSEGKLVAPFDGTVSLLFPTKHAIGLVSDTGVEVLIHVGLDTVELDGKGFTAHVKQGDSVKAGQLLLEVDLNVVKEAGYTTQTPVIITNSNDFQVDPVVATKPVNAGETVVTVTSL